MAQAKYKFKSRIGGGRPRPRASLPKAPRVLTPSTIGRPKPKSVAPAGKAYSGFSSTPPPVAAASAPGPAPGPAAAGAPDPRDANYWAQLAKLTFQRDQQTAQLNQQQAYADTDFAEALRRRLEQSGKERTGITQGANREGLIESGQLGSRLGDQRVAHDRAVGDARTSHERETAARTAARDALAAGFTLEEAALHAEAVDRQWERDLANPPPAPEPAEPTGGGSGGGGGPDPTKHYQHPVVVETRERAQQLWNSGQRSGKAWRDVISILGYDPRQGGQLSFRT